ncbi:hypothetical protein Tco_0725839 [Tanacetum coccineum]|uniref:Uncharacterized protein n=1 Tax=Tanacetum coccineum TaxID=301880 RepID=A0ABQ4YE00_9ASTR
MLRSNRCAVLRTQWLILQKKTRNVHCQNFKRWHRRCFFIFHLGLRGVLERKLHLRWMEPHCRRSILLIAQAVQAVKAWKHLDFLCHNYVLNCVTIDTLFISVLQDHDCQRIMGRSDVWMPMISEVNLSVCDKRTEAVYGQLVKLMISREGDVILKIYIRDKSSS